MTNKENKFLEIERINTETNTVTQRFQIELEKYSESLLNLPSKGQYIIGNTSSSLHNGIQEEYVIVYQAFRDSISNYAVKNHVFGGRDYSYSRMSWIKPNFLWMMYRSGWAEKIGQQRILAIWLKLEDFEQILKEATFTSFDPKYFSTEDEWRKELEQKTVRLQWDPDHDPYGHKLERRAIQLGLKGKVLESFGKEQVKCIMDISEFVKEQKHLLDTGQLDKIYVPMERVIELKDTLLMKRIGITL